MVVFGIIMDLWVRPVNPDTISKLRLPGQGIPVLSMLGHHATDGILQASGKLNPRTGCEAEHGKETLCPWGSDMHMSCYSLR